MHKSFFISPFVIVILINVILNLFQDLSGSVEMPKQVRHDEFGQVRHDREYVFHHAYHKYLFEMARFFACFKGPKKGLI